MEYKEAVWRQRSAALPVNAGVGRASQDCATTQESSEVEEPPPSYVEVLGVESRDRKSRYMMRRSMYNLVVNRLGGKVPVIDTFGDSQLHLTSRWFGEEGIHHNAFEMS